MLIAINTVEGWEPLPSSVPLAASVASPLPLPPGRPLPSAQTWDKGICFGYDTELAVPDRHVKPVLTSL